MVLFFASRRRHTRCALVTGVQTCALPIFVMRDYDLVADVHFRAGWLPREQSPAVFAQAVRSIAEPIMERPLNEISVGRLLAQLFEVTERFDMHEQPQLLLLKKTMLMAEGMGRQLVPTNKMWTLERPLVEDWLRDNRDPGGRIQLGTTARR